MTDSEKLDLLLDKVNGLDEKVDRLEEKVNHLEEKVTRLDADLQEVKSQVNRLDSGLQEVKSQVRRTNLILENEIRVNIQRVAEGHLDLSRNLHEAMRPSNETEMLSIRVGMLESDVKELKSKLAG